MVTAYIVLYFFVINLSCIYCYIPKAVFFQRKSVTTKIQAISEFECWYVDAMKCLDQTEVRTVINIPNEFKTNDGKIRGSNIQFECKAFNSTHIRWGRMVSFNGGGYTVLNLVLLPKREYDIPIFGVDIVSLPGGVLAAIDFQPLDNNPDYFNSQSYEPFKERFMKWNNCLPNVGGIPETVKDYFSPTALWTRFPLNDTASLLTVRAAFIDYMDCYRDLLTDCPMTEPALLSKRDSAMSAYLLYRIENDPAKMMLYGAFGKAWTDEVLREVIFPKHILVE